MNIKAKYKEKYEILTPKNKSRSLFVEGTLIYIRQYMAVICVLKQPWLG
jgi:hypothetical protein